MQYEYLTIEEGYRRNGHRHLERAIAYASAGYPNHFFDGSMKKALRNFKIADDLKLPEWMIKAVNRAVVDISDKIIYGNGDGSKGGLLGS